MVTVSDIAGTMGLDGNQFFDTLDRAEARVAQFESRLAAMSSSSKGLGGIVQDYSPQIAQANALSAADQNLAQATQGVSLAVSAQLSEFQKLAAAGDKTAQFYINQATAEVASASAAEILDAANKQGATTVSQLAGAMVAQQQAAQQVTTATQQQAQAQQQTVASGTAAVQVTNQETVALQQQIAALQQSNAALQQKVSALGQHQTASQGSVNVTTILTQRLEALGVPARGASQLFNQLSSSLGQANGAQSSATTGALGLSTAELGIAAAVVVVTGAILAATTGYIQYADQIRNTAAMTGLSQSTVEALNAEFSANGIAAGQATMALGMMQEKAFNLRSELLQGHPVTGNYAASLHTLGIDLVSFTTANADEQVRMLSDALRAHKNDADTVAAAYDLLGRYGRALLPVLEEGGSELDHWRQIVGASNADVSKSQGVVLQWHDALTQTKLSLQGLDNEIGAVALPLLTGGVKIIGLMINVVTDLLSPLQLVAIAIQGVEVGLGKLKGEWDSIPGPIRTAVEEGLKFSSVLSIIPEGARLVTSGIKNLVEGHNAGADAAKKHEQAEKDLAKSLSDAAAIARGAYQNLSAGDALVVLEDQIAKLSKTQQGNILIQQLWTLEMQTAGRATTDEATLTQQFGSAAAAAGIPISEIAKFVTLMNAAVQAGGTQLVGEALALDQAAQAALRDAAAHRQLLDVLDKVTTQQSTFTQQLSTLGQSAGASFTAAFGSAIAGVAQGLIDQANAADQTFNALGNKLLQDSAHLEDLKKQQASATAIAAAQDQVDSDTRALASQSQTVTQMTKNAGDYVNAVRQGQSEIIRLNQDSANIQQELSKQGLGVYADDARQRLATEQTDINQLTALWTQYFNTTDDLQRQSIMNQIRDKQATFESDAALANDAVRTSNERTQATQDAEDNIRSLTQQTYTLQHDYMQQTVEGHNAGLDQIGQHEQSLMDDLKRLWKEWENTTDEVQRGILMGHIKMDTGMLADSKITHDNIEAIVIGARQAYQDSQTGILSINQSTFDAQQKLQYATTDELNHGLAEQLNKVISTNAQELALYQQLSTETDPEKIFHIHEAIQGLQDTANTANQAANQIITASQNAAKVSPDTKAALQDTIDQTTAVVDLNAAIADGYNLQRSGLELQKQVKDSHDVVTQSQLDGMHAVTEAARAQAQADFATATAAQQNWLAVASTIDTTTGISTKFSQEYVKQAESAAKTSAAAYHLSATEFKDDLADETTASNTFNQQQTAAAEAQKTYAAARQQDASSERSAINALSDSYNTFTGNVVAGQVKLNQAAAVLGTQMSATARTVDNVGVQMVASAHTAAVGAQNAYEQANQVVLADERALTGVMSDETRKQLKAKLDADTAIKDGAASTASDLKSIYERDATAFQSAEDKKVAAAQAAQQAEETAADAWARVADAAYTAYNDEVSNAISADAALVSNALSTQSSIISANTAANQAEIKAKHETNAQLAALDREQAGLERQLAQAEAQLGQARAAQIVAQANLKQAEDEASVQSAAKAAQAQSTIAGELAHQAATIASLTAQLTVALAAQSDKAIVESAQNRTQSLVDLQLAEFNAVQLTAPQIAQIQADVDNARVTTGIARTQVLAQLESDWAKAAVAAAGIAFDAYATAAQAEGADAADLAAKKIQYEQAWAQAAELAANVVIDATNKATGSKTKDIDTSGANITDLLNQIATAAVTIDTHIGDTTVHVDQSIQDAAHAADTAVNTATLAVGNLTNALAGVQEQISAIDTTAATTGAAVGGAFAGIAIATPQPLAPVRPSQQDQQAVTAVASAVRDLADANAALALSQQAMTNATTLSTQAYADFTSAMAGSGSAVGTADTQYAAFTNTLGGLNSGDSGLGLATAQTDTFTTSLATSETAARSAAGSYHAAATVIKADATDAKLAVHGVSDEIKHNADMAKNAADAYAAWTSELGVSAKVALSAEERYRNLGRLLDDIRTSASMAQDAMDSLLGQASTEELQKQAALADINVEIADYNDNLANGGKANQKLIDALNKQQKAIQADIDQFKAHRDALAAHVNAQEAAAGATTLTMAQMTNAYTHFESSAGTLLKRVGGHWDDVIGNIKKGADEMQTAASAMVSALSSIASEMDKVASATQALSKANEDLAKSMRDAQKQAQGGSGGGSGGGPPPLPGLMASFQHGGIKHGDGIAYLHDGEIVINPREPVPGPNQGGLPAGAFNRQPISVVVDLRGSTVPQDPRTLQTLIQRGVKDGVNEALTRGAALGGVRIG